MDNNTIFQKQEEERPDLQKYRRDFNVAELKEIAIAAKNARENYLQKMNKNVVAKTYEAGALCS